ncbi:MAG: TIGR03618 family F420-dependent PPOX class oxidoreductase [Chloroflexi bacterium]|nr:TIGR03618 family F420-dependent PPOX class oxidoreductase [Chloroflexota bacterium]
MTPEQRDAFLREPRTAVLSTLRANGSIHSVPVWFRWDGSALRIITDRGSAKHRNAVGSGRASLCVDERVGHFRYVTAEGPVRVEDIVTRDERLALHTLYRGPEAAEKIVAQGGHEKMVLLVLMPERWLPSR